MQKKENAFVSLKKIESTNGSEKRRSGSFTRFLSLSPEAESHTGLTFFYLSRFQILTRSVFFSFLRELPDDRHTAEEPITFDQPLRSTS